MAKKNIQKSLKELEEAMENTYHAKAQLKTAQIAMVESLIVEYGLAYCIQRGMLRVDIMAIGREQRQERNREMDAQMV